MLACLHSNLDTMKEIITAGADVCCRDKVKINLRMETHIL